jgi:GAF domain-containing protein
MAEMETPNPSPELFAQPDSSAHPMHLLQKVNAVLAESFTMDDAVQSTLDTLYAYFPQEQITYWISTPDKILNLQRFAGSAQPPLTSILMEDEVHALARAARENSPICLVEPSAAPGQMPLDPDSLSLLCTPVTFQDRLLGVINLENAQPNAYDETDQKAFGILADNLASVLMRIKSSDELKLQSENQQMLYEITNKIRGVADIENILQTTIAEVARALKVKHASIELTAAEFDSHSQSYPSTLTDNQEGA